MIWIVIMLVLMIIIPFIVGLWFKAHTEAYRRDDARARKVHEAVEDFKTDIKRKED